MSPTERDRRQAAREDLASRLGVSLDDIEVVAAEDVTWPDTSMGCPQDGMRYLQVLTDGYRLVLRHDGREYPYHGGGRRGPFLCENPVLPS